MKALTNRFRAQLVDSLRDLTHSCPIRRFAPFVVLLRAILERLEAGEQDCRSITACFEMDRDPLVNPHRERRTPRLPVDAPLHSVRLLRRASGAASLTEEWSKCTNIPGRTVDFRLDNLDLLPSRTWVRIRTSQFGRGRYFRRSIVHVKR